MIELRWYRAKASLNEGTFFIFKEEFMGYDFKTIEAKWQRYWEENRTYRCDTHDFSKPKYYVLDMFPYPSGQGLHVGHPEGYTASDIMARMKRMQGYNVLHPMGFDSFGLPAEQYAIKTGNHPREFTYRNIDNFRRQMKMIGFSYDWSKEIATTDPEYYKWTQWIFLKMFRAGLAEVKEIPVNYCPELGTVLANEEVIDGKSERGGYPVIRKPMRQWVLKITAYADQLLEGIDELEWPSSTIEMQKNWIGRSEGTEVDFSIDGTPYLFSVFTTRADTLFGCSYCVLAPEHPLVKKIVSDDAREAVDAYIRQCSSKSDLERTELNKDKTGVFTGAYAINPINEKKVPIWIADYVLANYGTGAVMAVPPHDQRDYDFAKKYHLDLLPVIDGDISERAYTEDGPHIHSDFIDGMFIEEAKKAVTKRLEDLKKGRKKINYRLRDWLFSRQRYWGEPLPLIHMEDGTIRAVPEEELPLTLPELDRYEPSGTGESPLAHAKDWLEVTIDGIKGRRETNTMPQWAGSCWYYIRYIDPKNAKEIADPELIRHWLPVDLYIGGAEHAVLHLLYARFWHKFLYDENVVFCKEPFKKLFHQGMILGENGEKMSKSCGNVINPDEIVKNYGADTLRFYEMFMGPLEASLPWSTTGLDGAKRFLDRVYRLYAEEEFNRKIVEENDGSLDYIFNYTVKKIDRDFENLQFNTALAQMMVFINECYKAEKLYRGYLIDFSKMFSCVCPHLGEELYRIVGGEGIVDYQTWPIYDESKLRLETVEIAIQICGKTRGTITVPTAADEKEIERLALESEIVTSRIAGKQIKKIIVIRNKIVNIVAV